MKFSLLITLFLAITPVSWGQIPDMSHTDQEELIGIWKVENSNVEIFRSEQDPSNLCIKFGSEYIEIRDTLTHDNTPCITSFFSGGGWQTPLYYIYILKIQNDSLLINKVTDFVMCPELNDGKRFQEKILTLVKARTD